MYSLTASADFKHYKVDYSGFVVTSNGVGPFMLGMHVSVVLAQVEIDTPKVTLKREKYDHPRMLKTETYPPAGSL